LVPSHFFAAHPLPPQALRAVVVVWQFPGFALHVWQFPAHWALQQKPSTQYSPELHWVVAVHPSPLFFLALHIPPEQKSPETQSLSLAQEPDLQALEEAHTSELSQAFVVGAQACVVLSQALVVREASVHDGLPQDVPLVG
jgi:hypothetical protein